MNLKIVHIFKFTWRNCGKNFFAIWFLQVTNKVASKCLWHFSGGKFDGWFQYYINPWNDITQVDTYLLTNIQMHQCGCRLPGKGIIPFPTSNQQQQPKQISTVSVDYRHRRMAAGERRYLTPNQIKMKEKANVFFCEFIHSECIQVFDDDDECK